MRRILGLLVVVSGLLIAACSDQNEIDASQLDEYEVNQTFESVIDDDFTLQLNSVKEVYEQGEEVSLFGELLYTGEAEEITISHSSSAIVFQLEEQIRSYSFSEVVREIGMQTTLQKNMPYREGFLKEDVHTSEDDLAAYVDFIEELKESNDFPPGYYVVKGRAMFFDGAEHREIEAMIDFKVLAQ